MARERKTPLSRLWKQHGLTGAQVAQQAGISQTHLYEVARGAKTPSMEVAAALSAILDAPVEQLFPHLFTAGKRKVERSATSDRTA